MIVRGLVLVIVLVMVSVLGCGSSQEEPSRPVTSDLDVDPSPGPEAEPDPVSDHENENDHENDHENEHDTRSENSSALEFSGRVDEPRGAGRSQHASRWSGKPIDLDVKEADLHNVFRLLAEVGNVSIVVGDDVRGTVTLRLRSVPWDQALDTVARMEGLTVRRDGAVYMVTRASSSSSSASAPP